MINVEVSSVSIISVLILVAVALIGISNFSNNQSNDNQFRFLSHFIEVVSKELGVDREDVYVNTGYDQRSYYQGRQANLSKK